MIMMMMTSSKNVFMVKDPDLSFDHSLRCWCTSIQKRGEGQQQQQQQVHLALDDAISRASQGRRRTTAGNIDLTFAQLNKAGSISSTFIHAALILENALVLNVYFTNITTPNFTSKHN